MQQKNNLRIALQKSGKLASGSIALLEKCGIKTQTSKNQLFTQDNAFGLDFIFARDDDIPGLIEMGICDFGIIGQNLLEEYCENNQNPTTALQVIMSLEFARCRLSIATPKGQGYQTINDLEGKTIATSYPNTLLNFLNHSGINAKIVIMHGSVELAPQIGIADLICDLVSSGATLNEHGLQEFIQVRQSEAILICKAGELTLARKTLLDRLTLHIKSVLNANKNKYIMLHIDRDKLPMLAQILPGSESPTILELQGMSNKVAVHVISFEEIFWETLEKLKQLGASSIVILPIEKMVF